jgi:hypothetical protein
MEDTLKSDTLPGVASIVEVDSDAEQTARTGKKIISAQARTAR